MEETTNYLPHIIVGLVMMLVGWGIGFLDSNRNNNKKVKKLEADTEIAINEAKIKTSQAEAKLAAFNATPIVQDDPGLLRIKQETNTIALDLDGTRVSTNSITPEQRKRLIELVTLIRPWIEGKPAPAQSVSAPPPPPMPAPVPKTASTPRPTVPPPAQPAKKDDRPVAPANSIVGQIDSILQVKLATSPLANRGIFLAQSPEGGVIVYVDMTSKYNGVDEVPDPEIKAIIRAAIAEWEKKYTPGL